MTCVSITHGLGKQNSYWHTQNDRGANSEFLAQMAGKPYNLWSWE